MQTDNDRSTQETEGTVDPGDDMQEKSLSWLLEMDLDEPEEKLFALSDNEYQDEGLSEYEAEVAGRPMFRGNAASDDLATYVDEEIVISSDSERSDIYAGKPDEAEDEVAGADSNESMAIDYSQRGQQTTPVATSLVDDGSDILGLSTDDDIGEKFLTIKRVKASEQVQEPEQEYSRRGCLCGAATSARCGSGQTCKDHCRRGPRC